MRNCPYCAEEIQDNAIKCKHCGEWLDEASNESNKRPVKGLVGQSCPDGVCLGHITATGKCSVCGKTVEDAESIEKLRPKVMYLQRGVGTSTEAMPATKLQVANSVKKKGAWCPNCKSHDTHKTTSGFGCVFMVFIFVSFGLALIMIPLLPKTWHCRACGNEWRA